MDATQLIGLKGGHDATYWEIIGEEGRGRTTYYPSIKDGVKLDWKHRDYWKHKTAVERETIRMIVAGNPISAAASLKEQGYSCFAVGPTSLDIYPNEVPGCSRR